MSLHSCGLLLWQRYPGAPYLVPRMLRSAPPFAAWCAADPGPTFASVDVGARSAEQREERCTASGTRAEFALAAFLHQTRLINLRRGHRAPRIRSAARSGALLSRGPSHSVDMGPGSAEQREGRCTASGTRAEFALAAFLHQTRLINLRRGHSVPRISSAARSGALLSRGPSRSVDMGPGSAEQREERCSASGTREGLAPPW